MAAGLVSMCTVRLSVLLGVRQHAAVLLNVILGGTVLPHHLLLLLPAWRMELMSETDQFNSMFASMRRCFLISSWVTPCCLIVSFSFCAQVDCK